MPRRNTVLKRQARKMVYDVYCFVERETNELIDSLKQIKSEFDEATSILLSHSNSSTISQTANIIKTGNMKINDIISCCQPATPVSQEGIVTATPRR